MQEFVGHGNWWTPDSSINNVSGNLIGHPSNGSFLSLEKILDKHPDRDPLHYKIILGKLDDNTSITLVDCDELEYGYTKPNIQSHRFEVDTVIRGKCFENTADILFNRIKAKFAYLPDWL